MFEANCVRGELCSRRTVFEANQVRGELCSPTIQGYYGNPHLFTQGSKAGERSSPCGASHINRRPGFEARPAATSRKQSAHGYFLLRSEASNKAKPSITTQIVKYTHCPSMQKTSGLFLLRAKRVNKARHHIDHRDMYRLRKQLTTGYFYYERSE